MDKQGSLTFISPDATVSGSEFYMFFNFSSLPVLVIVDKFCPFFICALDGRGLEAPDWVPASQQDFTSLIPPFLALVLHHQASFFFSLALSFLSV